MSNSVRELESPLVSVGIPVYNGAKYIEETLRNILTQSYSHLEINISDNASTDDTGAICQAFAARDSRIRYLRQEANIGAARNFNAVIHLARGPLFKLANADDLCDSTMIERCVAVLLERHDVVGCYAKTMIIDETGEVLGPYEDGMDLPMDSPVERFKSVLSNVGLVNLFQGVIRTDALRRTRLSDDYPGADKVLASELALHGPVVEIGEPLFFRRFHKDAFSQLGNPVERQAYEGPTALWRSYVPTWVRLFGHARTVVRSHLSVRDKAELLEFVAREMFWRRASQTTEGTAF
jgi:glycosyltransferase involved in cell wall biosynthesis